MSDFAILVTTVDSDAKARELIAAALEAKLAACAQAFPVRSHYVWKGKLEEQAEIFIQMKIRAGDYAPLAALIRRLHSYETPEILRIDIAEGEKPYLDWLLEATRRA